MLLHAAPCKLRNDCSLNMRMQVLSNDMKHAVHALGC